jgi:hypothetical protein
MAALDEIGTRLEDFKNAGLITAYEVIAVDDGIRLRIVAKAAQDAAKAKSFVAEALAGLLSASQISVETEDD